MTSWVCRSVDPEAHYREGFACYHERQRCHGLASIGVYHRLVRWQTEEQTQCPHYQSDREVGNTDERVVVTVSSDSTDQSTHPSEATSVLGEVIEFITWGLGWILHFLFLIFEFAVKQISTLVDSLPNNLDQLDTIQKVLLAVIAAVIIYLIYYFLRDVVVAIKEVLVAIVSLLTAIVQNLPQVLVAGVLAAGASWLFNNLSWINFLSWD